jgi:hypothetical protein
MSLVLWAMLLRSCPDEKHQEENSNRTGQKIKLPLPGHSFSAHRKTPYAAARNPQRFAASATPMIDISDGLLIDLSETLQGKQCRRDGLF